MMVPVESQEVSLRYFSFQTMMEMLPVWLGRSTLSLPAEEALGCVLRLSSLMSLRKP